MVNSTELTEVSKDAVMMDDADQHELPNQSLLQKENEDLWTASNQTENIVMELSLDGIVRFVSKDWEDVVGTSVKKLINMPISSIILGNDEDKKLFEKATQVMEKEDMSYRCGFKVKTGNLLDRHEYSPNSDEEHTRGADEDFALTFSTSVPNDTKTFLDREVLYSGDTDDDDDDIDGPSKATAKSTHRSDTRSIGSSYSFKIADDEDYDVEHTVADADDLDDNILELEGQGMLMRDKSGNASHTMWLLKPFLQSALTDVFDIPQDLVNALGFGADVLVKFLKDLMEAMITEMDSVPAPPSELCRICERYIPTWWFERHSNICSLEHKCESELTLAHENLLEQRNTIASLIKQVDNHLYGSSASMTEAPASPVSSLNSSSSHTFASSTASSLSTPRTPTIEYRGFPLALPPPDSIGSPPRSPIRHSAGTQIASPLVKRALQQQRTGSGSNSGRKNPIRFMELLLELCDMALQISVPDARHGEETTTVHSPQSETRIHQVQGWAPSHVDDPGLAALCADTETFAKHKVEAAIRLGNTILYSERIRKEVDAQVHQVIEKTVETIIEQREQYYDEIIGDEEEAMDEDDPYDADSDDDHVPLEEPHKKPVLLRASTTPVTDSPKLEDAQKGHRHSTSTSIFSDLYLRGDDLPSPAIPAAKANTMERSLSTVSTSPSTSLGLHTLRKLNTNLHNTSPHDGSSSSSTSLSEIRGPRTLTPKALLSGVTRLRSQSNAIDSDSGGGTDDHMAEYDVNASLPRVRPRNSISSALGTQISASAYSPKPGSSPLSTARSMGNIHSPLTPFSSPLLMPHEQIHERYHRRKSSAASDFTRTPVSPLLTSTVPSTKPPQPSIRDYEIVNVISKGAFGSVYLARKKLTGEYFAIKVLKKQDMVVKNQVMNVKSERAILMSQADSPFVTKLFYTFQSKDYLFLVMEYLNGGDCAALIKALGGLSESWAQQYMAEVVVGVEDLHKKGIVHRDLKPDNLLIDQHGHLKLTDFGLSRMGLIGRQKKVRTGSNTGGSSSLADTPVTEFPPIMAIRTPSEILTRVSGSGSTGVLHDPSIILAPGYFNLHRMGSIDRQHGSGSFGSGSGSGIAVISEDSSDSSMNASRVPLYDPDDKSRKFVGTPDYLAPETINGEEQDERSDWWSLGCILFEFLFGYPPFHDETPERVFANILIRRIQWPPETEQISREAVDLIEQLLTMDPDQRLGTNGADEIKAHPFFMGIHNWDSLWKEKASFIPDLTNPESTDYFDSRGAVMQEFPDELADELDDVKQGSYQSDSSETAAGSPGLRKGRKQTMPLHIPPHVRDGSRVRRMTEPVQNDDFGSFSFKNLPLLERANKELITKLRHDSIERRNSMHEAPRGMSISTSALRRGISPSSSLNSGQSSPRNPSMAAVSPVLAATRSRLASNSTSNSMSEDDTDIPPPRNLPPKAIPIIRRRKSFGQKSIGSIGSPENFLQPPPAILQRKGYNMRRLSNMGSSPELREEFRRGFQQSRAARRSGSGVQVFDMSPYNSDSEEFKNNALQRVHKRRQVSEQHTGEPVYRSLDILLCIMNPVWRYSTEKMLVGLGNRVVSVADGAETIRRATGDVKFDIIFTEYKLPKTSGADVARLIHNTSNHNTTTPIVAITNFVGDALSESTKDRATVFESVLEKPPTTEKLVSHLERVCNWKRIECKPDPEAMPEDDTKLAVEQEAAA